MKKVISLAIAIFMLASLITIPTFADELQFVAPDDTWGESEDGIFYVEDVADLLAFSVGSSMNGNYAGKTIKLTEDIDMTGIEWYPIAVFQGTLDGDGHAIKGVKLAAASGTIGFITTLNGATIQNIRFLDFNVSVTTNGGGTAALIAGNVGGSAVNTFRNCYVSGTAATQSHRAAGYVGHTNGPATLKFENCIANVTCEGNRAGAFLAHLNPGPAFVEFTDCLAMGDFTATGIQTGAFVGVTGGHLRMTRCISLVNLSGANKSAGAFAYLDHQGADSVKTLKPDIELTDCYAAVAANYYAVAFQEDRSWPFNLTIKYGDEVTYSKESTEGDDLTVDRNLIEAATKYIANGGTVNVTKDNFASELAAFTGWTATDDTTTYADGKTIAVFAPTTAKELMDKAFEPKAPEVTPDDGNGEGEGENQTPDGGNENENQNQTPNDENKQTETNAPETQAPAEEKGGCFGSIGVSAAAVFALAGGAMLIARKKKES